MAKKQQKQSFSDWLEQLCEQQPTSSEVSSVVSEIKEELSKEAKVRELLEATGAGQMGKQAMEQMTQAFENMPGLPEGFLPKFLEMAKPEQLVEMIVPIYMKHVDTADRDALLAFFRTPAGKRWIQAQGPIMKESMEVGQKWGQELAMKVMEQLNEDK